MEWDKIEQLLTVIEKISGHPSLKLTHDEAMKELQAINDELKEEVAPPAPMEEPEVEEPEEEETEGGEEEEEERRI